MTLIQGLQVENLTELKPCVLVVDDEVFNLEIIREELEDSGYSVDTVENGTQALDALQDNASRYQAVLLDRMMPDMDGIEVLKFMKNTEDLQHIPVIMQTAKATHKDVKEGLEAGVLFYLCKPFDKKSLLAIVDTAVTCFYNQEKIFKQLHAKAKISPKPGAFVIKSIDEVYSLASLLAGVCPNPEQAVIGLSELLINGVEHGNAGIGFLKKGELQAAGTWRQEIERRLDLPENNHKKVSVRFEMTPDEVRFHIKDDGDGFEYQTYFEITPERLTKTNGRGIAIANKMCFDKLEYQGKGNEVLACIKLKR